MGASHWLADGGCVLLNMMEDIHTKPYWRGLWNCVYALFDERELQDGVDVGSGNLDQTVLC